MPAHHACRKCDHRVRGSKVPRQLLTVPLSRESFIHRVRDVPLHRKCCTHCVWIVAHCDRPPDTLCAVWAKRPTVSEMWYANNTEGKRKVRHRETDGMWTTPLMKEEKCWQPMETQVPASAKWYANNTEMKRPVIHRVADGKWSSEQHNKNPILHPTQSPASEKWDANRKEGRRQLRPMYASGPSGDNTTCYVLGGQRVYH